MLAIVRGVMKTEKEKKIVFIAVNASYSHFMLSYAYLRAYTNSKQANYSWSLVEQTINDDFELSIHKIIQEEPDIVISTLYLFNNEQCINILEIVAKILPKTHIFLGGPEFLGDNNEFLKKNNFIDAVFRGDESSFYKILDHIDDRSTWKNIPGICYTVKGKYYDFGSAIISENLDSIPSPYSLGFIPKNKAFAQLETSRGCHGKCAFCTSSISNSYNNFSIQRVKEDLMHLRNKGIHEIRILDRTFNEKTTRTLQLLEVFKNDFPEMRFHLEVNPAILQKPVLDLLKTFAPGKLHIEVGIQTLNFDISKKLNRYGNTNKALIGLFNLTNLSNIEIHADLIAGLPEQSLENIINDIKVLIIIGPDEIQLEILKVLPGTKLHNDNLQEIIYNSKPPYQVLQTNNLSFEQIQYVRCISKIIDGYYNSHQIMSLFKFLCVKYQNFLEDFSNLEFNSAKDFRKHQLKDRFLNVKYFISDFSDTIDDELLKFSWLAAGMPIAEYNLKSSSQPIEVEKTKLIWQGNSKTISKRHYIVTFEYPIAEMWLNNSNQHEQLLKENLLQNTEIIPNMNSLYNLQKLKTTYLFELAYGNNPSKIFEIN